MDQLGQIDFRSAGRQALMDLARGAMRSLIPGLGGNVVGTLAAPVAGFVFDRMVGRFGRPAAAVAPTAPSPALQPTATDLAVAAEHGDTVFGGAPVDGRSMRQINFREVAPLLARQMLNSGSSETSVNDQLMQSFLARGVAPAVAPATPAPPIMLASPIRPSAFLRV